MKDDRKKGGKTGREKREGGKGVNLREGRKNCRRRKK